MVRILVPVDFSSAAENAFAYALGFNKLFNAELVCLHAVHDISKQEDALSGLQDFINAGLAAAQVQTQIRTAVIPGSLEKAVTEFSGRDQVDLIIMGTDGADGFQKFFGGSHTTDLLSATSLPVLVVPKGFAYRPVHYMLLATDYQQQAHSNALDPVAAIAHAFDAEVRIAYVNTGEGHGSVLEHIELHREAYIMSVEGVKYSFKKIVWSDVTGGINFYLKLKGDNDILALVRRNHGFLDRAFRRDHAYEFACSPELPLLLVHE